MATAAEVQTAYRAIVRTDLNATVAQSIADAINNGTTSLDAYIASLVTQNTTSTGAAVAITAFVTGSAPSSAQLDALKVAADAQIASYTKLGVANPSLAAFEAFGRGLAVDSSTTAGFNTKYGSLSTADFITSVYFQVYGTNPSAAAAANLTAQINYFTTLYTQNNIPNAALAAKGAVLGQIVGYAFVSDASSVATIDNQVAAVLTAAAKGDASVYSAPLPAGTGNVGLTISLTANVDAPGAVSPAVNTLGSAGNDTFNAVVTDVAGSSSTLTAADIIRGGAGVDTLAITVDGTATATTNGADIQGIEVANVRNIGTGAAALDASALVGLTNINSDRSTGGFTANNVASGTAVGVIGNGTLTNGASTFNYVAGATSATVNVTGGTTAGAVTLTGTGLTSTTINSSGAANTLAGLTLAATTTSATINAGTNLTTGAITAAGLTTLKVAGNAATVNVGTLPGTVTTVDASGLTAGGLTAALVAGVTSFKGGQGNDVVTTAALTSTKASIIDAGAGTADRLVVGADTDVNTAVKAQQYAGFEVLQVGTTTADASLFTNSAINAVRFTGSGTVNNLTAAQAANITVTANAAPTVSLLGAANPGQLDVVKITVDDGAAAVSTITLANVTAPNVETLQFVANDKITISALTGSPAVTNVSFTGSQDVSLTTGALALNANSTVDASALTGKFTFVGTAATGANGISVTGSATAQNTLTGTANADKLVGGAGVDTLTGGSGADIFTGGAGADKFVFVAGDSGAAPSATVFETITDFGKASDVIDFAAAITFQSNGAASAGVAAISASGIATFNAADTTLAQQIVAVEAGINAGTNTSGETAIFQSGADSYVFISDGTAGVGANDVLIKLTGVTGLTAGTITGGDLTIA